MWSSRVKDALKHKNAEALRLDDEIKTEKQHSAGKLTARERIELLFDTGSFQEIGLLSVTRQNNLMVEKKHYYGDGVITGYGKVNGRLTFAVSQDSAVSGGAGGEEHVNKICKCLKLAIENKAPFVSLNESGGARIEEGIDSLASYSTLFRLNTLASGYIPQIAAIMGNCAGGASYSPALHDFVFMTMKSQMYITGPAVIKALTGEEISMDELGGYDVHSTKSGQAHFVCKNDYECINEIKKLLSYLPQNCEERTAEIRADVSKKVDIESIVPENPKAAYDVVKVIEALTDKSSFLEIQKDFASNICIGFARLEGKSVGIVANQPKNLAGSLNCDAADKASRFIRFCDCFNIPIITLVDVTAFLPGKEQEYKGILRHGSKLIYAYAEATVPKITLIMRKAYGGAYCAMNSKNLGADVVFAWPICELAVMGAEGAVRVICKKQLDNAEDKKKAEEELVDKYNELYLNPYFAASRGLVDEIILPEQTRDKLIKALAMLENKTETRLAKKHGNLPL